MPAKSAKKKHQFRAWMIWVIAVVYYLYEYIQRIAPSIMVNELMKTFQITALGVGNLNAIFFYAYALFQIPVGYLSDRFGPKRPLLIASIICSIGAILFSQADSLYAATMARAFVGIGSAFGYICCLRLTINWFDRKQFAFMCGLVNMVGLIGAVLGEVSMSYLMDHMTWRFLIFYTSLLGLVVSFFIFTIVKDFPSNARDSYKSKAHPFINKSVFSSLKKIMRSKQVWLISLFVGTAYCSFDTLAAFWGVPYLQHTYGLTLVQSSKLNGLIFIGGIAGFIIFGWITSHTRYQHKRTLIISSLCLLIISLLLYSQPQNIGLVGLLLFAMGLFSATIPTATDFLKSLMPVSISGLTISVSNFTVVIVGAISQPLFGYLLERKHPASTSLDIFGASDFHQAFILMPIIFAISLICALLIKQVHSQASH